MKVEDIVEGLNRHIESRRKELNISTKGHIVLLRNININPTFKAYKEYTAELWYVKNSKKYRVITVAHTAKVLDGQEESIYREINVKLVESMCQFMLSEDYNSIIDGTYNRL